MKTAEEILSQLQKENPTSILVFKAMEEYAQQEAIAFNKWIHKEGWKATNDGTYYYQPEEETPFLTTDQLYNVYLKNKIQAESKTNT